MLVVQPVAFPAKDDEATLMNDDRRRPDRRGTTTRRAEGHRATLTQT